MCSLINKQLLLTAYAYLFIMEQQKGQQGSEALQLELQKSNAKLIDTKQPSAELSNQPARLTQEELQNRLQSVKQRLDQLAKQIADHGSKTEEDQRHLMELQTASGGVNENLGLQKALELELEEKAALERELKLLAKQQQQQANEEKKQDPAVTLPYEETELLAEYAATFEYAIQLYPVVLDAPRRDELKARWEEATKDSHRVAVLAEMMADLVWLTCQNQKAFKENVAAALSFEGKEIYLETVMRAAMTRPVSSAHLSQAKKIWELLEEQLNGYYFSNLVQRSPWPTLSPANPSKDWETAEKREFAPRIFHKCAILAQMSDKMKEMNCAPFIARRSASHANEQVAGAAYPCGPTTNSFNGIEKGSVPQPKWD